MANLWIYGLDENYALRHWNRVPCVSMDYLRYHASSMHDRYKSIREVYAIDASPQLSEIFRKCGGIDQSVENRVLFRDALQRSGVLLWSADRDLLPPGVDSVSKPAAPRGPILTYHDNQDKMDYMEQAGNE